MLNPDLNRDVEMIYAGVGHLYCSVCVQLFYLISKEDPGSHAWEHQEEERQELEE